MRPTRRNAIRCLTAAAMAVGLTDAARPAAISRQDTGGHAPGADAGAPASASPAAHARAQVDVRVVRAVTVADAVPPAIAFQVRGRA